MRRKTLQKYRILLLLLPLLSSCSTQRNTWLSRHYQELNTRFNVYFNGHQAYLKGLDQLHSTFAENYAELLPVYETGDKKGVKAATASMTTAVQKCQKAIKEHSIRVKPEKKPGYKASPEAKLFYNKEEFNPFMDNVFLLMAKAQLHMGDFAGASATCSYIVRHFPTLKPCCDEAGILQARAYLEQGWYYEAEHLLNTLNQSNLTRSLIPDYSATMADLLLRRKNYEEALPYLEIAVRKTTQSADKLRWGFLLGQVYQTTGRREKAYAAFGAVVAKSPPYEMELNARIHQSEVFPITKPDKPIKTLVRMSKDPKNALYLDRIHYAMGNLYLVARDTTNALEHFHQALSASTKADPQKRKTLLTLGHFYYQTQDFLKAEPCYTQLAAMIEKTDPDAAEINAKATALKALAPPLQTVFNEDSLQAVAAMPEAKRNALIAERMLQAEKKAKEEAKQAARKKAEETLAKAGESRSENVNRNQLAEPSSDLNLDKSWYFYNPTTVEKGLKEFRRKWGKRSASDDWRRAKKTAVFEGETLANETSAPKDTVRTATDSLSKVQPAEAKIDPSLDADDPRSKAYYLKDLPLTQEQLTASNERLAHGLYLAGVAYREHMDNDVLALRCFDRMEKHFPKSVDQPDAWYLEYLLYKQHRNEALADTARRKLLTGYPDHPMAQRLKDNEYLDRLQEMFRVQDTLYANTYEAFVRRSTDSLFARTALAESQYPTSRLMPRFYLLEALEQVRKGKADEFHRRLTDIQTRYPQSDIAPLVKSMLTFWDQGQRPSGTTSYQSLLTQEKSQTTDSLSAMDSLSLKFTFEPKSSHYVLLAYDSTTNVNRLQFDVALYNFTNYLIRDFDLSTLSFGKMNVLLVGGFESAEDALRYLSWIHFQGKKPAEKYPGLSTYVTSEGNLGLLQQGASIEKYLEFYRAHYTDLQKTFSQP
jgi:tetratricopeptide (TPR) repeat protein